MIRYFVLNLLQQTQKAAYVFGGMAVSGIPPEQVELYPAKSGDNYSTTESIIKCAENDGFDFTGREIWTKFMLTYTWDVCNILRRVIENDYDEDYYIFLEDDRIPKRRNSELNMTAECLNADGKFLFFQMFYKHHEKYDHLLRYKPFDAHINRNATGHCLAAFMFTRAGANFLLDQFLNNPNLETHRNIEFLPYYVEGDGIYSVRNPTSYIMHLNSKYFGVEPEFFQDGRLLRRKEQEGRKEQEACNNLQ